MASADAAPSQSSDLVEKQLLKVQNILEDHLDAEIEKIDKFDDSDLERLRKMRIDEMKKQNKQKQEWMMAGHGEYSEIADERDFFDTSKRSDRLLCHFFIPASMNCKILDKHMQILAQKHLETKFSKMNAEKTPFLVEKLKIKIMPTLVLIKDGAIVGQIRGFDQLGGRDDFPTDLLEWRLAKMEIIDFSADQKSKTGAPSSGGSQKPSILGIKPKTKAKKSIRDDKNGENLDSDDEDDW